MATYFNGEIILFAGDYVPDGWLRCDGSMLSKTDYSALYDLIKNTYGGDDERFALPDLSGRVPLSQGVSTTGTTYALGAKGGADMLTLMPEHLPSHTHTLSAANVPGDSSVPEAYMSLAAIGPSDLPSSAAVYAEPGGSAVRLSDFTIGMNGGNQYHENTQPSLGLNYIICVSGVQPA